MSYSLVPVPLGSLQINELIYTDDSIGTSSTKPVTFSLIIPTYNESKNLEKLVEVLSQILNSYWKGD